MAARERSLDDSTVDRLLRGAIDPLDAPPGYGRLAEGLRHASVLAPAAPHPELITALAAAARSADELTPARRSRTGSFARRAIVAKAAAVGTALVLSTTAAAAATGTLPDLAQRRVAEVVSHVGVDLPRPAPSAPASPRRATPMPARRAATDHPSPAADHRPTGTHGQTVASVAHDDATVGSDRGAAVSDAAHREHDPMASTTTTSSTIDVQSSGRSADHRADRADDNPGAAHRR